MKSLREQIAELNDPLPKDFDPESIDANDDDGRGRDSGSSRDEASGDFDGREHYENVGPGRLRKPIKQVLGKKYAGIEVTLRKGTVDGDESEAQNYLHNLEGSLEDSTEGDDDDETDPVEDGDSDEVNDNDTDSKRRKEMRAVSELLPEDEDEEIESDQVFGKEHAERFQGFKSGRSKMRNASADQGSEAEYSTDSSFGDGDRLENSLSRNESGVASTTESEGDDSSVQESESEVSSDLSNADPTVKKAAPKSGITKDRAALRALLSSNTAAVASSLSAAASADAEKGRAVKIQYETFDRLVDARIKLQKGLSAANSIPLGLVGSISQHHEAIKAAEEAALTLWNTIISIRHTLTEGQNAHSDPQNQNKKRKRPVAATPSTPLSTLWYTMDSLCSTSLPHHRTVLDKWSAKIRASNPTTIATESRSRLLASSNNGVATDSSITEVIDGYLVTETPKVIAQSTDPARPYYEDTLFYQSLLRDLIASRSSITTTTTTPTTTNTITKLHPSGSQNNNNKSRKIDPRASKGRKIRYTVHEKLQNFTAAERYDRTSASGGSGWSEDATAEFFASLMGSRGYGGGSGVLDELDEHDHPAQKEEDGDGLRGGDESEGERRTNRQQDDANMELDDIQPFSSRSPNSRRPGPETGLDQAANEANHHPTFRFF